MSKDNLEISLSVEQRVRLWAAFRGGNPEPLTDNQEHRWTLGVDRMLMELRDMLWAGEITLQNLGVRFEIRTEGGGGPGGSSNLQ